MGKYLDLIAEAADAWRPPLTRYEEKEKNELNRITSFNSFSSYSFDPPKRVEFGRFGRTFPLARTLEVLEQRCPDHVPLKHWQQATEDGRRFLIRWGEQAERLGCISRQPIHTRPIPAYPDTMRSGSFGCCAVDL
jgi:hypothetical protein